MKQYQLAEKLITGYIRYLRAEERSTGTFEKYLLDAARAQGRERLSLLLEAICATGIRVSEAWYITVEAARESPSRGRYAPPCCLLNCAASCCNMPESKKTVSGKIFLMGNCKSLSRRQIWANLFLCWNTFFPKAAFGGIINNSGPDLPTMPFTRLINSLLFGSLYCSCTSAHRH